MKKIFKLFLFLITLSTLSSCGLFFKLDNQIKYDEYKNKVENKESFTIFFGRQYCNSCDILMDNLKEVKNSNDNFRNWFSINIQKLDYENVVKGELLEETHKLIPQRGYEENNFKYESFYTPTTLKYVDGKLVYAEIGEIEVQDILFLQSDSFLRIRYYENLSLFDEEDSYLYIYDDKDEQIVNQFYNNYYLEYFNGPNKYFMKRSDLTSDQLEELRLKINDKDPMTSIDIPETFPKLYVYTYSHGILGFGNTIIE